MGERRTINIADIIGGGYRAFWFDQSRYRVVKGGKASKKSTTTALWYIYHLMKMPGSNLLVVRNVANTLHDSCFAQLKWAINTLGVQDYWKATENPIELKYIPTGQRIIFRGFDDVDKLASTTVDKGYLCWVWIEEAFEIASESEFDRLDLSVPRGKIPVPLFKQTTITFNPWSEKHWLKKRFFDTPKPDVFTLTTNYMCNEYLDDTDRHIYEEMKEENPRKYAVAGLGNWGIAEGLVYDKWTVCGFNLEEIPDYWKCKNVFGLDYGYTNDPTAFIAMAVNKIDKIIYIYDEHYEKRMLNTDIAAMIIKKGYGKERIRADSAEPKSNADLRRLGITRICPAVKGKDSITNGISTLQEYKMVVHPRCKNTIAELSCYCWDTKRDDPVNKPVDRDNHLMDAMRYAMEDIKFFRASNPGEKKKVYAPKPLVEIGTGLNVQDFKGGWNG